MPNQFVSRALPILLFTAFTLLYGWTAVSGISTADNAEFQLVSTQLGLAHPPGFPLYTVTSHLFTRLPLPFSAAVKANLFTAVSSALTLVFVYLAIKTATKRPLLGVAGAVMLGTATTFWAQATVANVRSMTGLFTAVALWSLVNLWRERERRGVWTAVFTLAISFGVTHHLSLVFIGIVMGVWVIGMWRTVPIRPFLLAPLGLLPLLYLPLHDPSLREWDAFWHYALAQGFESDFFYFVTAETLIPRLRVMLNVLLFQFEWPIVLFALIGLVWMMWKRLPLAILIIGMFTVHTLITATYRAPQTVEYMLVAYILVAMAAACAPMWVHSLFSTTEARRSQRGSFYGLGGTILAFVGIGLGVWQGWGNFGSFVHLREAAVSDSYTLPIMNNAPQNAQILTNWHWYMAFRTQQEVNGIRPDIDITFVDPTMRWGEAIVASAGERPTIATNWNERWHEKISVPPHLSFHEAFLFGADAVGEVVSADVPLNEHLKITGYAIEQSTVSLDEEMVLTVQWEGAAGVSLFAHLVDENLRLLAQDDVSITNNPMQLRLTPRPGTVPGLHTILIGTAGSERMPLVDVVVTESAWRPITRNQVSIKREGETLVGYDTDWTLEGRPRTYLHWQNARGYYTQTVDEPTVQIGDMSLTDERGRHYVPMGHGIVWLGADVSDFNNVAAGERVEMAQEFGAGRPVVRDLAVSVTLTGYEEDGVTWAWQKLHDGTPAMGGIPTLKWVAGSRVRDPHWIDVPEMSMARTMVGTVIMYDAFTNRVVPILDERIMEQGQGVRFLNDEG